MSKNRVNEFLQRCWMNRLELKVIADIPKIEITGDNFAAAKAREYLNEHAELEGEIITKLATDDELKQILRLKEKSKTDNSISFKVKDFISEFCEFFKSGIKTLEVMTDEFWRVKLSGDKTVCQKAREYLDTHKFEEALIIYIISTEDEYLTELIDERIAIREADNLKGGAIAAIMANMNRGY